MALRDSKNKIKEFVSVDLLDVQGEINTKGNYIYFSGSQRVNALNSKFQFTLTIAGVSLTGDEDSIESTLEQVLIDICEYEISNGVDLDVKSEIIKLNGDLLAYKVVLNLEDETR